MHSGPSFAGVVGSNSGGGPLATFGKRLVKRLSIGATFCVTGVMRRGSKDGIVDDT